MKHVSEIHPDDFRESLLSIVDLGLFDFNSLESFTLTKLSFPDFLFLWNKAPDRPDIRGAILKAADHEGNLRLGKFIFSEYLEKGGDELVPFVSRFVRGGP